jgi:putative ABC transport system substrate-binding protein
LSDGIFMVADSLTLLDRKRVSTTPMRSIFRRFTNMSPFVHDGGLMSYGADLNESMERAAELAAKILGGSRPADLPVEEPTHYPLVINLKTAKRTGIELPPNFVALADDVIE